MNLGLRSRLAEAVAKGWPRKIRVLLSGTPQNKKLVS
jgi:hypothetical protein